MAAEGAASTAGGGAGTCGRAAPANGTATAPATTDASAVRRHRAVAFPLHRRRRGPGTGCTTRRLRGAAAPTLPHSRLRSSGGTPIALGAPPRPFKALGEARLPAFALPGFPAPRRPIATLPLGPTTGPVRKGSYGSPQVTRVPPRDSLTG
ncbi:hypothetical protein GCM10010297_39210 [Streptomyces malachitofuscus]|nr:hypothetical protein GCM10010297_39210 [Streptomyces malachitofuscus]